MIKDVKEICSLLLKNYNADVLNFADEETKREFKKYSRLLLNHKDFFSNGNLALATCINNYFKPKIKYPKYLSGTNSYILYYSIEYKIWLYLFSDITHTLEGCKYKFNFIDIDEFFYKQISNSTKFIDFFNEYMVDAQEHKIKESFMRNIFKKFKNCHTKFRDPNCPKNARIHYVDIRPKQYNLSDVETLLYSSFEDYKNFIYDYIQHNNKLHKELYKLPSNLRQKIIDIYSTIAYEYILENKAKYLHRARTNEELYLHLALVVHLFIMDLYFLARFFKKYQNVRNAPSINKHSIIYAGSGHIKLYDSFFEKMGFYRIEHFTNSKNLTCIPLNNLSKLFNYDENKINNNEQRRDPETDTIRKSTRRYMY